MLSLLGFVCAHCTLLLSAPALSNWPAITRLVYFIRTVAEMCRPWCLNKVRYRNLVLPERIVSHPEADGKSPRVPGARGGDDIAPYRCGGAIPPTGFCGAVRAGLTH